MDRVAKRATIKASGNEVKGRGGAQALVGFRMTETNPAVTNVAIDTDLTLNGAVAQYGRASGVIADISQQIIDKFAVALKARIETEGLGRLESVAEAAPPASPELPAGTAEPVTMVRPAVEPIPAPAPAAIPISGFSILFRALWRSFKRVFTGG
jgi:hypothetical protein